MQKTVEISEKTLNELKEKYNTADKLREYLFTSIEKIVGEHILDSIKDNLNKVIDKLIKLDLDGDDKEIENKIIEFTKKNQYRIQSYLDDAHLDNDFINKINRLLDEFIKYLNTNDEVIIMTNVNTYNKIKDDLYIAIYNYISYYNEIKSNYDSDEIDEVMNNTVSYSLYKETLSMFPEVSDDIQSFVNNILEGNSEFDLGNIRIFTDEIADGIVYGKNEDIIENSNEEKIEEANDNNKDNIIDAKIIEENKNKDLDKKETKSIKQKIEENGLNKPVVDAPKINHVRYSEMPINKNLDEFLDFTFPSDMQQYNQQQVPEQPAYGPYIQYTQDNRYNPYANQQNMYDTHTQYMQPEPEQYTVEYTTDCERVLCEAYYNIINPASNSVVNKEYVNNVLAKMYNELTYHVSSNNIPAIKQILEDFAKHIEANMTNKSIDKYLDMVKSLESLPTSLTYDNISNIINYIDLGYMKTILNASPSEARYMTILAIVYAVVDFRETNGINMTLDYVTIKKYFSFISSQAVNKIIGTEIPSELLDEDDKYMMIDENEEEVFSFKNNKRLIQIKNKELITIREIQTVEHEESNDEEIKEESKKEEKKTKTSKEKKTTKKDTKSKSKSSKDKK